MIGNGKCLVIFFFLTILASTACNDIGIFSSGEIDAYQTRRIRFFAGADSDDVLSRTCLGDENAILWTSDDRISVLDGTADRMFVRADEKDDSPSAEFTGTVSSSSSVFYLVSPYQDGLTLGSGGIVSDLLLPSSQTAVEGSFPPSSSIMCARSTDLDNQSVKFKHLSSYLKFTPQFDCSQVRISSNAGEALAGKFLFTVGDDGSPSSITPLDGVSTVTLSSNPIKGGETYMAGLLPGVLEEGFHITFVTSEGVEYSRSKRTEVTLTSGHCKNLGEFTTDGTWDSISLSRSAIGLVRGKEFTLSATTVPQSAGSCIKWSSSDESIAEVSDAGTVTAIAPGVCTITAGFAGVKATCEITVVASSADVFRYGYSELSSTEKAAYDYMLERVLAFEDNSKTYSDIYNRVYLDFSSIGYYPSANDVMRLTNILMKDVPEVYMISNYIYRYDYDLYQYYIRTTPSYTTTLYASQMKQIYEQRDAVLESLDGKSEFEKALLIHDRFINGTVYGDVTGVQAGNIVGGLINHRVVCEGFSRSYLFLLQQAGMAGIFVCGSKETSSETGTRVSHAWNDVRIGSTWYMTDVTEDGGLVGSSVGHGYFLVGQTKFDEIHQYLDTYGVDQNTNNGYTSLPSLPSDSYPMDR